MKGLRKLKQFYNRYERYLIPGALIFGFITDALTFHLINFTAAMLLLLFHLLFSGVNICVINFYEEKKIKGKIFSYWKILAPLFLQYSFGNLFSAFLIFYSHSGSFFASWPFIIVIIFLMIGNEVFRKYNTKPTIQISVFFFALFSYLNIVFPSILKNLSVFIFLGSGIISLILTYFFITFLSSYAFKVKEKERAIFFLVGSIFLAMNLFYFLNLIPPIPLSVKSSGVYHEVKRVDGGYEVTKESCGNVLKCFLYYDRRYIRSERQVLYLFSAVHAPSGMDLNVVHQWQKFNDEKKRWETIADIPFSIVGGREVGYRWYTYYSVYPGYWRVNIKTEDGKTIGRKNFYVFYRKNIKRIKETI